MTTQIFSSLQTDVIAHLSQTFVGLVFRDRLPVVDSHVTAVDYPVTVSLMSDTILNENCGVAIRNAVFSITAYDRTCDRNVDMVAGYSKALMCLVREMENFHTPTKRILTVRELRSYVVLTSEDFYAITAVVSILYQENSCDQQQAHYPDFVPSPDQIPYERADEFVGTCANAVQGARRNDPSLTETPVQIPYSRPEKHTPPCADTVQTARRDDPSLTATPEQTAYKREQNYKPPCA